MITEFSQRDGGGWNIGLSILVSAGAIFFVLYPSVLFLTGFHTVTLVYGLLPAVGGAVLIAGWAVQQEWSVSQLWLFALVFISIVGLSLVGYRLIIEPYFFGDVYGLHYLFERFGIGVRIGILGVVTVITYLLAQ